MTNNNQICDDKFNPASGGFLEKLIFNNRLLIVLSCFLITLILGYQIKNIDIAASYEKTLPKSHPYIQSYIDNRDNLRGLGNEVRVVVEAREGTILDANYLETLAKINDEIFIIPGVDRPWMRSLFLPVVRYTIATEEGFTGGPVLPDNYDGSQETIGQLATNIKRADLIGSLVANDLSSSMIVIPLLPQNAEGEPIDLSAFSSRIEEIRKKYESAGDSNVRVYVIGFAKLIGDLIDGLYQVMFFFLIAAVIAVCVIYAYTRCIRSSVLVLGCSIVAVVWQLGLVTMLGYSLDPYSMLVPFLVIAIGVSHGAQKMNGIMQDVGRGTNRIVAARLTFRRLFLAGMTALLADVVGFAVLMIIDIPVIQELALTASIGVGVLIFTNLILIPVLLSYVGVSEKAAQRSLKADQALKMKPTGAGLIWRGLEKFAEPAWAVPAIVLSGGLLVWGLITAQDLKIGDVDSGAPELRPDSRYNKDNRFITENYSISSDLFAVMVKTPAGQCGSYETLTEIDRLDWHLKKTPGVQRVESLAGVVKSYTAGMYEGNPKWATVADNQGLIDAQTNQARSWNSAYLNNECNLSPVVAYLSDHRAETLSTVVSSVESFAAEHNTENREFLLAAGTAGVSAATNIVVEKANRDILLYVYLAVALLCLITFRSVKAVIVALVPLILTSILAEALMVHLNMGVKVATLPVVALGVGIGVDYAIYLLSTQLAFQRMGYSVKEAYSRALASTGKVVALVGVTLAAGVVTWIWSPIKYQADMGVLLTFMFIWNMLGALVLVPALSIFLLKGSTEESSTEAVGEAEPAR